MAIFRGTGGSGDSSDSSFLDAVTAQAEAAEQSRLAAVNATTACVAAQISAAQQASAASASATSASNSASSILNLTAATGNAGTQASYNASTGVLTIPRGDTGAAGSDANVTYTSVRDAGALMDAEIANPEHVKLFNSSDYLQNLVEDTTPQLGGELNAETNNIINVGHISGAQLTVGNGGFSTISDINLNSNDITNVGTVDGRDVAADGTKLDGLERTVRTRFQRKGYTNTSSLFTLTTNYTTLLSSLRIDSGVTTAVENVLDLNMNATFNDINSSNEAFFVVTVTAPNPSSEDTINMGTVVSSAFGTFSVAGDFTKHFSPYCGLSKNSDGSSAINFSNQEGWQYDPVTDRTTVHVWGYQSNIPATGDTAYLHPFDWETSGTEINGDVYPIEAYNASGTVHQNQFHNIYLGYYKPSKTFNIKAKEAATSENVQINRIAGTYSQIIGN